LKKTVLILFASMQFCFAQQVEVPSYFKVDTVFSDSLHAIVKSVGLDSTYDVGPDGTEQISFAVVDLNGSEPVLGGVHYDNFIYPASVYKMYVAMEVLAEISHGDYSLYKPYVVKFPNVVDKKREVTYDPRPPLLNGDTVNINYLLDLMITRSDNTAANCLIDIATRDSINNTIHQLGWYGSEVTRKFLSREYEDSGYVKIRGTETCALHAADFMYKIYTNQLINPWVSMQLKALLGRQLDTTKLFPGLPRNTMYYHKTGWWHYYTNDVGIVDNGKIKYIISCFVPLTEPLADPKMKILSEKVFKLIQSRHEN
jgi:beta-lactamase class A